MEAVSTSHWKSLEQASWAAFLLAGVLWLCNTVFLGFTLVVGFPILPPGLVHPLLTVSGLLAAMVGLLGFYPGVAGQTPRLARVSAGLIAVAGVGMSIELVWFVTAELLNQPDPFVGIGILSFYAAVLFFILFGIVSARTGVPPRTVSLLVLAIPATILASFFLVPGVYGGRSPDWASLAIGTVMSVLGLAIGYLLATDT